MAYLKQVTPFLLKEKPNFNNLEEKLSSRPFVPVSGLDWFKDGFTAPMQSSGALAFIAEQTVSVCLKREERILPRPVITRELEERVKAISEQEGRKVGKKERKTLREQIIEELLPRALVKDSHIYGLFVGHWLFVGIANEKRAENFISVLREALGGLQVQRVQTQQSPVDVMTQWLLSENTSVPTLDFGSECTMTGNGETEKNRAKAKVSKHDLTVREVLNHAEAGKTVKEIGLVWDNRLEFVFADSWTFKRVVHSELKQNKESDMDLETSEFANQLLLADCLNRLTEDLIQALGGYRL